LIVVRNSNKIMPNRMIDKHTDRLTMGFGKQISMYWWIC
jgi:hypothetical protein